MKTVRLALVLLPSLAGAPAHASAQRHSTTAPPQGAAGFDASAKPELEVTRAKTGHLLVQPTINGREAGWFIFDTGAGICVISTPIADRFELEPAAEIPVEGVGGNGTTSSLVADTLELGPLTLHDVPLLQTDLSFLREHLGYEIAGVIGYGVLSKCIVELDLRSPRIALHDAAGYTLPAGEWMPLELDEQIPTVKATYEGREGRFQLDIGSNGGMTFQEPTVRRLALLSGRQVTDSKLGGVGGFIAAKSGRIAWLELAGVRLTDVDATFPLEAKGVGAKDTRDGSLGVKVLESFLVTFDYAGERISFRPRPAAPSGG